MLLLKANPELKSVFQKLIKTMDQPVTWTEIFVITNNSLILAGSVRSLIFNFDNKRSYTSIIELPEESSQLERMPSDGLINNILNITLYSFGKWGGIKGLTVDKNYEALNALFGDVLRPVNARPDFSRENFRFFKGDVQITYEDVMLAVLKQLKKEGKLKEGQSLATSEDEPADEKNSEKETAKGNPRQNSEEDDDEYELGLWHSLSWKKESCEFLKESRHEEDAPKSRIGNNFYITNYLCPKCHEKLYMGVYPVDRELLIETEEGRVYMARTYACHVCNTFYTPRPKKLLQEGDVYSVKFDEDRTAYEDYLDVLGSHAERTANHRFNEFEAERNQEKEAEAGDIRRPAAEPDADDISPAPSSHSAETASAGGISALKEQFSRIGRSPFKNRKKQASSSESQHYSGWSSLRTAEPLTEAQTAPPSEIWSQTQSIQDDVIPDAEIHFEPEPEHANLFRSEPPAPETDTAEQFPKLAAKPSAPVLPDAVPETQAKMSQQRQENIRESIARLSEKTTDELRAILADSARRQGTAVFSASDTGTPASAATASDNTDETYINAVRETLRRKLTAKYDARMKALEFLSAKELTSIKKQVEKEELFTREQKDTYTKQIHKQLFQADENALAQKIELSKSKSYADIGHIIEEVEAQNAPDDLKQDALAQLKEIRTERARREVEHLLSHVPLHVTRKQLTPYLNKLEQYTDVDLSPYKKQLEQRKDIAEKEEISMMIKRGGKKDRAALWNLYEQLQKQDFKEENKAPYLEKIYTKIRQMDEAKLEQICPNIATLTFANGLRAYNQIEQGMFLPELKTDSLEMIKRRLTKLKTDECVQLMRKLKHDLDEKGINCDRFYFYNAREELKSSQSTYDEDDSRPDRKAMLHAIDSYASARDMYEYPVMVCDTSRSKNGREGFVLTPDHIFYRTLLGSGIISIVDIEKVQASKSLFGKGVYAKCLSGGRERIPNPLKSQSRYDFAEVLDDFVGYLQEKPESRSLEYMAKEKHDVKCCYRCGFIYKSGNVCPRCGSKMNH